MGDFIDWQKFPFVKQEPLAKNWLSFQQQLGRSENTLDAYGRSLDDYLQFNADRELGFLQNTREHIAHYIHELLTRPNPKLKSSPFPEKGRGLASATVQLRLTVVRLFYDYLVEEGLRKLNPVGRGKYTKQSGFGGRREAGIIPRFQKLPWIPTDEQWNAILVAAKEEPVRNRLMLALAYDAALRREELCSLAIQDIDPAYRLLRIRAETTKNRRQRTVPYSVPTGVLLEAYLKERRALSMVRGSLFLSVSRRNMAKPLSIWSWSKIVEGIARRAGVEQFSTHTFRHLCLTDLARADWDIHQIALFAGHRNPQTTLLYIHLSGRDLKAKMEKGMAAIHQWRMDKIKVVLQ